MAWYEPKVDWASNETVTVDDWNHIIEDAYYILTEIGRNGHASIVSEYVVTQDVTQLYLKWWQTLRTVLVSANEYLEVQGIDPPSDDMTSNQLNKMETLLLLAWRKLANNEARLYTNDGIYSGDDLFVR